MKILIIVDSIDINDSSGSKANVAIINNLVSTENEVFVYHYTRKNIDLAGAKCFSIPEIRTSALFFLSRLQRYFTIYSKKNINPFIEGKLGFSLVYLNDIKSIVKSLKKCTFEFDMVLTLSKGGSFRPHNALLKMESWHKKWLAYIHDPYPYHFYPRPYNWVETSYRQKEKFVFDFTAKARWIGFPSLLLKDWMASYFSIINEKAVLIPHQATDYLLKKVTLPAYFEVKKFNILHAGALAKHRPPNGILEGFSKFLKNNPDAKQYCQLIFVGGIDDESVFSNYINNPNIIIQKQMPFDIVFLMQQNASVNCIIESKSEISPFLPAKFPHCVAANKPILSLSPYYSEVRRLLGNDYPYWAEVDDSQKIATLIEVLYNLWLNNPTEFKLNKPDLQHYLSAIALDKTLKNL